VNKRNRKTESTARRNLAVPPSESSSESTPETPVSDAESIPPLSPPNASVNGDEETALARLADDGAPLAVPVESEPPSLPPSVAAVPVNGFSLEERVRRLEDALNVLQEQRATETSIVPPPPQPPATPVPVAAPQPTSTAVLLDMGKRLLGAATQTVTATPMPIPNIEQPGERGGILWLLWDTWIEARVIVRMFVDPRYQLPWSARVLPLFLLAAILTSYYWIPGTTIPLLGSWLNKAVDLLLAFLLYKWLGHEARRYRRTSPDVPPNLRL
jgi:hypothetical protein